MNPIVAERRQDLARLCEEHSVARLDVFGSAVTGEFDPETSDLDFLVTFQEAAAGKDAFDKQIGLQDALAALFGRKVDLIPERSITNPYFRANVEDTREPVYPNWDSPPRRIGLGDRLVRATVCRLRDGAPLSLSESPPCRPGAWRRCWSAGTPPCVRPMRPISGRSSARRVRAP